MKIAVLGPFPPPLGGVSTNVKRLSQLLREDGYQVRIFVEAPPQENPPLEAFWYPPKSLSPRHGLVSQVKAFSPELIHSHASTVRKYDAALSGLLGIPLVYQIYGERFPDQFARWSKPTRFLTRIALGQANKIIPASEDLARFIKTMGIPEQAISVIPCLLPLERTITIELPETDKIAKLCPLDKDTILLVSSGFYEPHYGLGLIPQIAAVLKNKKIKFSWLIVGRATPKEHQDLQSEIENTDMADCVAQVGELNREEMIFLLNKADFYVRTKSSDSFGIVIAEAHQLGCHCLFADSNPYFQPDGKRLFSYRSGDASSLTETLLKQINRFDPHRPRDRKSPFRDIAEDNYRKIKQIYLKSIHPEKQN